jgi:hypothetical protein
MQNWFHWNMQNFSRIYSISLVLSLDRHYVMDCMFWYFCSSLCRTAIETRPRIWNFWYPHSNCTKISLEYRELLEYRMLSPNSFEYVDIVISTTYCTRITTFLGKPLPNYASSDVHSDFYILNVRNSHENKQNFPRTVPFPLFLSNILTLDLWLFFSPSSE